jgi:hypothetical protein
MHTFRDTMHRIWTININVSAIKKTRALIGVDLLALVDGGFEGLNKLMQDPITLVDTLYCLCKDEADAQKITDEDFGRAMAGDVIEHAADAFLEELTDFFPDARRRAAIRDVMEKGRQLRDRVMDHLEAEIRKVDMDAEAEKLIGKSGNSPASSDLTPAHSPSAN